MYGLNACFEVVALVRNDRKAQALLAVGAKVAVADALNKVELSAAIRKAEPDPLDPNQPANFAKPLAAIRHLKDTVQKAMDLQAFVLRCELMLVSVGE